MEITELNAKVVEPILVESVALFPPRLVRALACEPRSLIELQYIVVSYFFHICRNSLLMGGFFRCAYLSIHTRPDAVITLLSSDEFLPGKIRLLLCLSFFLYITVFDFSSFGRFDNLRIKFATKKTNQSSYYLKLRPM